MDFVIWISKGILFYLDKNDLSSLLHSVNFKAILLCQKSLPGMSSICHLGSSLID